MKRYNSSGMSLKSGQIFSRYTIERAMQGKQNAPCSGELIHNRYGMLSVPLSCYLGKIWHISNIERLFWRGGVRAGAFDRQTSGPVLQTPSKFSSTAVSSRAVPSNIVGKANAPSLRDVPARVGGRGRFNRKSESHVELLQYSTRVENCANS